MNIVQNYKLVKEVFRTTKNPLTILLYRAGVIQNISIKIKKYGMFKITSEWNNIFIFNLIYSYLVNVPKEITPSQKDIDTFKKFIEDILSKK